MQQVQTVQTVQARFPVDPIASNAGPALASVWARMHIADLMDRAMWDQRAAAELPQMIEQLALQYGLMSSYTSFIAVDSSAPTAGDHGTTVSVAVPVPEGMKYDTTMKEN